MRRPRLGRPSSSDLKKLSKSFSENLAIYHCDIRKDNFLINYYATGQVCIIDFEHIGVLPKPFQSFAFFNSDEDFAAAVGRKLGYKASNVTKEMVMASGSLWQSGWDGGSKYFFLAFIGT